MGGRKYKYYWPGVPCRLWNLLSGIWVSGLRYAELGLAFTGEKSVGEKTSTAPSVGAVVMLQ